MQQTRFVCEFSLDVFGKWRETIANLFLAVGAWEKEYAFIGSDFSAKSNFFPMTSVYTLSSTHRASAVSETWRAKQNPELAVQPNFIILTKNKVMMNFIN